jgi:CHRD domain
VKMIRMTLALVIALSLLAGSRAALADGRDHDGQQLHARLIGYEEVPAVSTAARGRFTAKVSDNNQTIDYTLTFGGLTGTVQQSHIHIAQPGVNGSIVIWLCQTATTPAPAAVAALTPTCPQPGGTVSGTITAANVINAATASQQIVAGELAEVLAAIRAGVAYVNVHATPLNPGGEIRGQIRTSDDKN